MMHQVKVKEHDMELEYQDKMLLSPLNTTALLHS